MFFKFKPFEGPARFVWKDPDTGRDFSETSKAALVERIVAYRRQNNLETIDNLSQVLENYWCGLPENQSKCSPVQLQRGFLGYIQGGVTLVKNMVYDRFVHQNVADKRASVCVGCPHNVFPDKEGFIAWSDKIAEASTLGRKSQHHEELGNCEVCSCPLRAKVWLGGTITLEPEWVEPMQKVNCWQIPVGRVKNGN